MCRVCTTVTPNEPQIILGADKAFTFDFVFDTFIQQAEVYNCSVERLVEGINLWFKFLYGLLYVRF